MAPSLDVGSETGGIDPYRRDWKTFVEANPHESRFLRAIDRRIGRLDSLVVVQAVAGSSPVAHPQKPLVERVSLWSRPPDSSQEVGCYPRFIPNTGEEEHSRPELLLVVDR